MHANKQKGIMTINERVEFALCHFNPMITDDDLRCGNLTLSQYRFLFNCVESQMQCIVDYGVK